MPKPVIFKPRRYAYFDVLEQSTKSCGLLIFPLLSFSLCLLRSSYERSLRQPARSK